MCRLDTALVTSDPGSVHPLAHGGHCARSFAIRRRLEPALLRPSHLHFNKARWGDMDIKLGRLLCRNHGKFAEPVDQRLHLHSTSH